MVAAGLGAMIMSGLSALSVSVLLGAAPMWASQMAMIGAGVGAVLAFVPSMVQGERASMWALPGFLLAAGAFGAASWGQIQVAASRLPKTPRPGGSGFSAGLC